MLRFGATQRRSWTASRFARRFASAATGTPAPPGHEKDEPKDPKEAARKRRQKEIREELRNRLSKGPFYQVKEMITMDKKLFPTSDVLINRSNALILPKLAITALDGSTMQVPHPRKHTLLLLGFNDMGYQMLKSWREAVGRHEDDQGFTKQQLDSFQIAQVSVVEGWLFRQFPGTIRSMLRTSLDPFRYHEVGAYFGKFDTWKNPLGIENPMLGYVYLIEKDSGRIRFRGCGVADVDEAVSLVENLKRICDNPRR